MNILAISHRLRTHALFTASIQPSPLLALANAADDLPLLGIANAITIGEDGWVVIAYGDTLHNGANAERANSLDEVKGKPGVIQRFNRARAEAMANAFHSIRGRIKRAVIGMDVYKGHPDCAAFANLFPDKSPRGTIADMEAREDGLALRLVLNERGATDVDAGWDEISPFWYGTPAGEENGRKIYEPSVLKSIGLVQKGNMPGLSLVNADPASLSAMKNELIKLLALLGITVPAETAETPEAFAPFLADAKTKLEAMMPKADLDKVEAGKTKAEGELAAANARILQLTADHTAALANASAEGETKVKALRTQAATAVITAVIAAGKLPAAKRDEQVTALANAADFTAAATALANATPVLPTDSKLSGLGENGKDQQSRQGQLLALVNAHMGTAKCDYDTAYTHVCASPAGKAIIETMKAAKTQPAAK